MNRLEFPVVYLHTSSTQLNVLMLNIYMLKIWQNIKWGHERGDYKGFILWGDSR